MIILRQKQFGFWDFIDPGYSARVKRYNEQKEKDKQEIKQKEILDKISSISPQHRVALEIEKEAKKYTWGGLDEYPYFHVIKEDGDKFGDISLSYENKFGRYHWNGKYWEEVELQKFPRRVTNLKSDLLNRLKTYRNNVSSNKIDNEIKEGVIYYLNNLIQIIKKSAL